MEGLGQWWQQLGWRETGVKIKGTNIVRSFHAARHCLGTVLANPARPRSRQSCICGVRSLDQGSAQIFHKEPDGNIRVCSTKATTDTRKHMDLARLADPAWTAGVGSLGREQGQRSFGEERRAALPGHRRSKPTGLWTPGWGAVSSQGSQGLKGEGKGGRQSGSW